MKSLEGCKLTKQPGRPTHKGVATTRHELSQIYARAKTSHKAFPLGSKFGLAAAVIKTRKYIDIHNAATANIPEAEELDEAWEFENPVRPSTYDDTALPANLSAAEKEMQRRKQETERAEELKEFDVWQAYETWAKGELEEAYGESYLEALKDDILGFTHVHVSQMLAHLSEQCLAITTKERKKKLKQIELEWTPGDDIRVFFTKVQKLKDELEDEYGIEWTDDL